MPNRTITIPVDTQTAQAWSSADQQKRRKLEALAGLFLWDVVSEKRPSLDAVLEEVGRKAQTRGLTPEILDSILKDV